MVIDSRPNGVAVINVIMDNLENFSNQLVNKFGKINKNYIAVNYTLFYKSTLSVYHKRW